MSTLNDSTELVIQEKDFLGEVPEFLVHEKDDKTEEENKEEPTELVEKKQTLHEYASSGDVEGMTRLIEEAKVDVNTQDETGNTALMLAIKNGKNEAIKILLENGAQADLVNGKGSTALHMALREERIELIDELLQHCNNVNVLNDRKEAPLHIAAIKGETDACEKLVQKGGDVNIANRNDERPLHIAIKKGHSKTAKKLISLGASLEQVDIDGNTPLHLAANKSMLNAHLFKLVLKQSGENVLKQNNNGNTALHLAAAGGHYKSVEYLIDHGVAVDLPNSKGDTPLHLAAESGYALTAKLLLYSNRQIINKENKDGILPIYKAAEGGEVNALIVFLDQYTKYPELWEDFQRKVSVSSKSVMKLAIESGREDAVIELLKSKFWEYFLSEQWDKNGNRVTPLQGLIRSMPSATKYVLDKCIDNNHNYVTMNYQYLDDQNVSLSVRTENSKDSDDGANDGITALPTVMVQEQTSRRTARNHPMKIIADSGQQELMMHPLVLSLLRRKWRVSLFFYLFYLVFYSAFVASFSALMIMANPPYKEQPCSRTESVIGKLGSTYKWTAFEDKILAICVYAFCGIGILFEFMQLILSKPYNYFKFRNLIDWFTFIAPILVVTNFSPCNTLTDWQWQLGVCSLFVSYMNLLHICRIIPSFGLYITMIKLMVVNFFQFLTVMLLLIVSFAICFFLLVPNQTGFSTVFISMVNSYVMMVGEMNFSDLFLEACSTDDCKLHYRGLTWTLFIIFLIFMVLIIMNLLTSLAVKGIDELISDSQCTILAAQINMSMDTEFARSICCSGKPITSEQIHKPKRTWVADLFERAIYGSLSKRNIYQKTIDTLNALNGNKQDDMNITKEIDESITRKTRGIQKNVQDLERNVDDRLSRIEKDIRSISDMLSNISTKS